MSRRGENIYKRKDGRWEARYVKCVLPDGRKKYGSVYARTYNEVKEKQKQRSTAPEPAEVKPLSLEEAYNSWILDIRSRSKPNTVIKYEGIYNNHLRVLKDLQICSINRETVSRLTAILFEKGLKQKTVNDILIVLNSILKYCAAESGLNLPRINYITEPKKEMRVLSLYEQKLLTKYLENDIDIHKFGVLLALYTGLRIGELCALKWEDFDEYSITVDKTMMRVKTRDNSTEIITAKPKSISSIRRIPIPLEIRRYLKQFKGSGYVLSNKKLEFTEPRLMQYKFEKYADECNLKYVTFHTLRHTFATRCIEAGVDVKTVSELLGHSDAKITLNCYVHSSFELKQTSIQRMEALLA